jgi:hypothetical protein
MILNHFSSEPLQLVDKIYNNTSQFKPSGLWLSKDDQWYEYAINGVRSHSQMRYKTVFEVDTSNVIVLKNSEELLEFHNSFPAIISGAPYLLTYSLLNWPKVAEQYDGVVISPYQKIGMINGTLIAWHESWDVSSGCFWNIKCLKMIECFEFKADSNSDQSKA